MKKLSVRIQNRYHSADEWREINPVLEPGEIGIESNTRKVKYGDGETAWRDLPYAAGGTVSDNINAENVYFTENIIVTKEVGYIEIENGRGEIPSKDKNLKEVFEAIFVKEVKTGLQEEEPYISFGNSDPTYVEIGTTVTPKYNISFGAGKYKYGPAITGVTMSSYNVTNNKDNETKDAVSGTFGDYKFTDVSSYKVNATCTSSQGAIPFSNLGNEVADQRFAEATRTAPEKTLFTSYKPNFYGYTTSANKLAKIDATTLTSDFIRDLQVNQKETTAPVTSYEIKEGWYQFFYAMPLGRKTTLTAKDANNITCTVGKVANVTVKHEGTAESTDYVVFYIDNAAQYGATTIQMTWA